MSTGPTGASRRELVHAAVARWANDLIDTGKRNPLLYYRDLQAGTLTFDAASDTTLTDFLAGSTTKLSTLFPAPDAQADALKRIRTIRKKITTLQEERGIQTGYLAMGMATWEERDASATERAPAAPILLREITIKPRTASEDDFDLVLAEEAEYNPVLVHHLATQFGAGDDLSALPEDPDEKSWSGIADAFGALESACSRVPGFSTSSKLAIGSFSYQKLPMVKDLETGIDELVASDVIAALAGDAHAQASLRTADTGESIEPSTPNFTPPQDEFLVLDADSSQNYAINAALSGAHVVIKGPPGTGKSQTIANLMSSLMGRGKKVLFVAEKRAAIDAVLSRLHQADLDTWVMDLHDGLSNRRRVAQQLGDTLNHAARARKPDLATLHRELVTQRNRLIDHSKMMHSPRDPWGSSIYELQTERLELGDSRIAFRFRDSTLRNATRELIEEARRALTELADLGGLSEAEAGAWSASPIDQVDQARRAIGLVQHLRRETVPETTTSLRSLASGVGLTRPASVHEWRSALELMREVAQLQDHLTAEVFTADLDDLIAATATSRWRKESGRALPRAERRKALKDARRLAVARKPKRPDLHGWLVQAAELLSAWRAASADGQSPRAAEDLDANRHKFEVMAQELDHLGAFLAVNDLDMLDPEASLPQRLDLLIQDQGLLHKLPRIRELERQLSSWHLDGFLAECRALNPEPSEVQDLLTSSWLDSILDEVSLSDPAYGAFQGTTLDRAVASYQEADHRHIESTRDRVQRAAAETLYATLDAHPEQALLIRKQANLKRRHMSMRELLSQAEDVLLAAKPCWAMSPLVVSQVLPLKQMFDVVIFDEASQVPPADAIPSIARGSKLVVAGDERQLPPTAFFAANSDDVEDDNEGAGPITLTSGFESILDALAPLLSVRNLQWHYRSRDERLIAFSNAHIYESSLTTFPGSRHDGVLKHVHVPWASGLDGIGGSSSAEVEQVVDLVVDHAENRPEESLGVIAMGMTHADRIDAAIRERLRHRPDLEQFFSESRDERFFVKNLERVQGDERDAIIMSVGYGKSADGRMLYRFGPINNQGGERRLNVAVSRAKRRMTLVSSFGSADLDRSRLNARGAELLGQYVAFMESGGKDLGSSFATPPPGLNPFEQDVRDRLSAAGLKLEAQFGVSGYRIDFVAAHPDTPGRFVLAIEADGASYHSSATARDRDRLRQEHLERLGWRFHRIWSTDWFRNPEAEVEKVLESFTQALEAVEAEAIRPHTRSVDPETPDSQEPPQPRRTRAKPRIRYGEQITAYSGSELEAVIRWIESDGLLRTEEDLVREAMNELGWRRRGQRIDLGLREAIAAARR